MRRRPALAGPYSAPGHSAITGCPADKPQACKAASRACADTFSQGMGNRPLGRRASVFGQRAKALDHGRQRGFVQPAGVVEHAATKLADKAGALRDAGKPRNQR